MGENMGEMVAILPRQSDRKIWEKNMKNMGEMVAILPAIWQKIWEKNMGEMVAILPAIWQKSSIPASDRDT